MAQQQRSPYIVNTIPLLQESVLMLAPVAHFKILFSPSCAQRPACCARAYQPSPHARALLCGFVDFFRAHVCKSHRSHSSVTLWIIFMHTSARVTVHAPLRLCGFISRTRLQESPFTLLCDFVDLFHAHVCKSHCSRSSASLWIYFTRASHF
jgi:hypothetical protein